MRIAILLFLVPCLGFSQNHLMKYYNEVAVTSEGDTVLSPWVGGINSAQVNTADLDGDQQNELIVLDRNSAILRVFTFEEGRYIYQPEYVEYLPEVNLEWIIFADYNCDGKKDIFNFGQNGAIVYKNTSVADEFATWEKVADPLLTTGFSGKINLYVNPADIPAVQDIDGDGDLDILSYNFATGEDIRYHRNMALENNGSCEMFDYVIEDRQWGQFKECSCFEYAFGGETCSNVGNGGRTAHIGGKSLTASDQDGDGDQDLFLGHDDCASLIYLENTGDADSALFVDFSSQYPPSEPAEIPLYPTVQFLDVNFDDAEEMIVSPNIDVNLSFTSDFAHSLWEYRNNGTANSPEYTLVRKNFLQNDMLDFGEMSAPAFFDVDGDGDKDLLVATNGKEIQGILVGKIVLLENTGTSLSPTFRLVEDDFLNLSSLGLHVPKLRMADFTGDGRADLFFAGYDSNEGQMVSYVLPDVAEGSNAPHFNPEEALTLSLPLRLFENPEFFDEDSDGDPDLLIGMRDGALMLYENTGDNEFLLKETEYKGIGRDFSLQKINLFAEVYDYDHDGREDLITADRKEISVYLNFLNSQPDPVILSYVSDAFPEGNPIPTQHYNWLAFADLFGTGFSTMISGGSAGGLQFFRNRNEIENPDDASASVKVYPNPAVSNEYLVVETNKTGTVTIYNLWGQIVSADVPVQPGVRNNISLPQVAHGVYILVYSSSAQEKITRKLVIK